MRLCRCAYVVKYLRLLFRSAIVDILTRNALELNDDNDCVEKDQLMPKINITKGNLLSLAEFKTLL